MVTSGAGDKGKVNLGLSLKFDAKALKVIDYSRKDNTKYWEFSEKAIRLISEYKVRGRDLGAARIMVD